MCYLPRPCVLSLTVCRYNNKTYRVDDIDWDRNPTFQFEANVRVNGPERRETERKVVTMVQYYQQVRIFRIAHMQLSRIDSFTVILR